MPQLQTGGFVALLVRAGRDDGAAAALGARLVGAGAEEQGVTELPGHTLEELPQRLTHTHTHRKEILSKNILHLDGLSLNTQTTLSVII